MPNKDMKCDEGICVRRYEDDPVCGEEDGEYRCGGDKDDRKTCPRALRRLVTEWAACAVDCKMDARCGAATQCVQCDSTMVSLCRRSLRALGKLR